MSEECLPPPLRLDKRLACPQPDLGEWHQAWVYVPFSKEMLAAIAGCQVKVVSRESPRLSVQLPTGNPGEWGSDGEADAPFVVEG